MPEETALRQDADCPGCEAKRLSLSLSAERQKALVEKQVSRMASAPGVTTEEAEYRRRLSVCDGCRALRDGLMCSYCGSYVAYRARIARARCPSPEGDRWIPCGS